MTWFLQFLYIRSASWKHSDFLCHFILGIYQLGLHSLIVLPTLIFILKEIWIYFCFIWYEQHSAWLILLCFQLKISVLSCKSHYFCKTSLLIIMLIPIKFCFILLFCQSYTNIVPMPKILYDEEVKQKLNSWYQQWYQMGSKILYNL